MHLPRSIVVGYVGHAFGINLPRPKFTKTPHVLSFRYQFSTANSLNSQCNCDNVNASNKSFPITNQYPYLDPTDPTLKIDHESPLVGTAPSYDKHIVISTGKTDWPSRIESQSLARDLKAFLRSRKLEKRNHDPTILVTNSSYNPSSSPSSSAYLFPQNIYFKDLSSSSQTLTSLYQNYLLPSEIQIPLNISNQNNPLNLLLSPRKVHETHILICTHYSRDRRCGILGPILYGLFTEYLRKRRLLHPESHDVSIRGKVRVGCVSHIGGHKFAGNVIVYLPPRFNEWYRGGIGIWYGRVGSEFDVEEIVESTVLEGEIVERMFRGGVC